MHSLLSLLLLFFYPTRFCKIRRCNTQYEGKMLCTHCCRYCCCTFTQPDLITRAVVEPMLSHVELPMSYGQQPKALTLQYTLHGSQTLHGPKYKYIAWITDIAWTQIQIHCMDHRHCMDPNTNTLHGSQTLHGPKYKYIAGIN